MNAKPTQQQQQGEAGDGIVYSSLQSLLMQQVRAAVLSRSKRSQIAHQQGGHTSVQKGRGMDYAESRPYIPGDDVRMLDWQVIARTGKPHTKIFQEERERPVVFWVDFRPSMYFATRQSFKSVVAAEVASLLAWKSWSDGDRVGGILTLPGQHLEQKPARNKGSILRFIRMLADATQAHEQIKSLSQPISLADEWQRLLRVVSTGSQVVMISDFRGIDKAAESKLVALARHASLHFVEISDPFENELPKKGLLRMTDGKRLMNVMLGNKQTHEHYQQQVSERSDTLSRLAKRYRAGLTHLSTQDDSQAQLIQIARGFV